MSAAEYALRLANGEPLEAVLHEVWGEGYAAAENMARSWGHTDSWEGPYPENPFTGETASE